MKWTYDRLTEQHTLTREDGWEVALVWKSRTFYCWECSLGAGDGEAATSDEAKRAAEAALVAQAEDDLRNLKALHIRKKVMP